MPRSKSEEKERKAGEPKKERPLDLPANIEPTPMSYVRATDPEAAKASAPGVDSHTSGEPGEPTLPTAPMETDDPRREGYRPSAVIAATAGGPPTNTLSTDAFGYPDRPVLAAAGKRGAPGATAAGQPGPTGGKETQKAAEKARG